MKIHKYTFILLLLIGWLQPLGAQLIKIEGTVFDITGQPITFAGVAVSNGIGGTTTNLKGHYSFRTYRKDTLKLVFGALGYNKVKRTIVKPGKVVRLNVTLQKKSIQLETITIEEQKVETKMVERLKMDRFRLLPDATGGSIEAMISTFAGVSSHNELSSQYMVRGGNYDENLVYVNGIEVYRPLLIRSGKQEGLSFINPDMIKEVRFSAGGFDATYGDKFSSVLDIDYLAPKETAIKLAGSLQGGSLYLGHAKGRFSQAHGVRYKRNATLLGSLETKGEYDPTFIDYQTFLTYQLHPQWSLSFLGNISNNSFRFAPQTRTTKFGTSEIAKEFKVYYDGQEKDLFTTYFGAMTLTHKQNEKTEHAVVVSAFQTDEQVNYDITGEYWISDVENPSGATNQLEKTLGVGSYHEHARNKLQATVVAAEYRGATRWKGQTIRWGIGNKWERITDNLKEWQWRDSAGYAMPFDPKEINMVYNLYSKHTVNNQRTHLYLQDGIKWLNRRNDLFSLSGGIRVSHWNFNKEWLVSPRLSFAFVPNWEKSFAFRVATGIYYQAPFYKEYRDSVKMNGNFITQLNNKIQSPRSYQLIVGMDHYFKLNYRPFKFTAEAYYKKLERLIPYSVDNVRVVYAGQNAGNGYTMGLDMKLFGEFLPGVDSWVSFSLMKSEEEINGKKIPRPTDQRYNFSLFFQDYFPGNPKYKMQLRFVYSDGLPFGTTQNWEDKARFRMAAYKRVDLGISRQLVGGEDRLLDRTFLRSVKNIWIGLDVFNLFNINNVNSYYWMTDIHNKQYAVPNYLTTRQVNLRFVAEF